jgi:hypothetical protein
MAAMGTALLTLINAGGAEIPVLCHFLGHSEGVNIPQMNWNTRYTKFKRGRFIISR